MRSLFFMLLLAAPLALFAQEKGPFSITGKIKGFRDNKLIYLGYMKGSERVVDSCLVRDNTYHFTGSITEGGTAVLADTSLAGSIYPRNGCEIFLMAESFTVTHIDSFSNAVATGSKVNEDFFAQQKGFRPFSLTVSQLYKKADSAKTAGDTALAGVIDKRIDSLYNSTKEQVYGNYLRQHPQSPLALTTLERYAGFDIDPAKIGPMFEALSDNAKSSTQGKAFKARIDAVNKTAIGREAMDFTQNDTAGLPIKLSSFRGKYVLLDFWASWCHPCREENPNVVKAYAKYHPKGLDILSVSLDKESDKAKWLKAIHDDKLTWTHVSDLKFWGNEVAKAYGIMGIPQNYLIDPQGRIVAKNLRGEDLEKKLQELLP